MMTPGGHSETEGSRVIEAHGGLARLGLRLITGSVVASATLPWLADWNRRHTFGPEGGPHARWHGTSEVVSATTEGLVALWLLRNRQSGDPSSEHLVTAAALLPIARWAPFNLTLLIPGTSPFDQHRIPQRILGMPAALLSQDLIAAAAALGLILRRTAR
jgi:hypothetical protein